MAALGSQSAHTNFHIPTTHSHGPAFTRASEACWRKHVGEESSLEIEGKWFECASVSTPDG